MTSKLVRGAQAAARKTGTVRLFLQKVLASLGILTLIALITVGVIVGAYFGWQFVGAFVAHPTPAQVSASLVKPDVEITILSLLVTAVTFLGVIVTIVAILAVTTYRSEAKELIGGVQTEAKELIDDVRADFDIMIDHIREEQSKIEHRSESTNRQLGKYEKLVDELERLDLKSPVEIEKSILIAINDILRSSYRPAEELKRDIIASIERDILEKIVDQYRSALAMSTRK